MPQLLSIGMDTDGDISAQLLDLTADMAAESLKRIEARNIMPFRVGGDEFIAFRPDGRPENLPLEIEQIRRALAEKGYHLSLGTSVRSKAGGRMDMLEIVSEAESRMYADKKEFYSDSENDRRSR